MTAEGKIFCDVVQHQAMASEWVSVYTATSEFESDMIVRNLLDARVETKAFSFRAHLGTHWLKDAGIVHVYVHRQHQRHAVQVLHDLRLVELQEGE